MFSTQEGYDMAKSFYDKHNGQFLSTVEISLLVNVIKIPSGDVRCIRLFVVLNMISVKF